MPFRLKKATSTFLWTMANIFKEWINQFVKMFIDDVNIHSGTWNEHLCHIWLVLQKLKGVHLKLNPNKCCFGSKKIMFLGHIVNIAESQLDPKKITTIQHFSTPNTTMNVRAFLGLTRYYKKFIVGYAKITKPHLPWQKKNVGFLDAHMSNNFYCIEKKACGNMSQPHFGQHSQSWGFGVLRDSWMFSAR